jgi:NAD(P)-dependent dehydrogenase (short-subunit alcohol dehydrogenase family)
LTRVAVVTGGSSGIGAELARRLAVAGWHPVLLARREERLQELGFEYELCDVGDRTQVEAAAARVLERHPRIDLLVNNAGVAVGGDFLDADPERVERAIRVNYLGSVWALRAFLPGLERGSHVVNVVSVAGTFAGGPYSASKHAQLAFSRSVARELAPRGVSVHTVNPGFVETEGFPQRGRHGGVLRRLVVEPPFVAERIMRAIEHDQREITVPRWYRVASLAQAIAPTLVARLPVRSRRPS